MQRQNYLLLRADEVGKRGWLQELSDADLSFRRGLPTAVIAQFTRELSVMLQAGQDIDRALRFLVETTEQKRVRELLQAMRDQVRGGKSLAAALAEHPPSSRVSMSASCARAKQAASLPRRWRTWPIFSTASSGSRRASSPRSSIRSCSWSPRSGRLSSFSPTCLPSFTPIFAQAGAELPTPPGSSSCGDVVRDDGGWILIGLLGLPRGTGLFASRTRAWRPTLMLAVPVAGLSFAGCRPPVSTRTLGTLLRNGVGLVIALGISRDVLSQPEARKIVAMPSSRFESGERVATSLADGRFFPPQTIHLLQIGEETGKLSEMALRAADIHDEQVQTSVQRLVSLLVPIVTIVMGLIVAGIVGSLLVAMLSLNDLAI